MQNPKKAGPLCPFIRRKYLKLLLCCGLSDTFDGHVYAISWPNIWWDRLAGNLAFINHDSFSTADFYFIRQLIRSSLKKKRKKERKKKVFVDWICESIISNYKDRWIPSFVQVHRCILCANPGSIQTQEFTVDIYCHKPLPTCLCLSPFQGAMTWRSHSRFSLKVRSLFSNMFSFGHHLPYSD